MSSLIKDKLLSVGAELVSALSIGRTQGLPLRIKVGTSTHFDVKQNRYKIGRRPYFLFSYAEFSEDALEQILINIAAGYRIQLIDSGFDLF